MQDFRDTKVISVSITAEVKGLVPVMPCGFPVTRRAPLSQRAVISPVQSRIIVRRVAFSADLSLIRVATWQYQNADVNGSGPLP